MLGGRDGALGAQEHRAGPGGRRRAARGDGAVSADVRLRRGRRPGGGEPRAAPRPGDAVDAGRGPAPVFAHRARHHRAARVPAAPVGRVGPPGELAQGRRRRGGGGGGGGGGPGRTTGGGAEGALARDVVAEPRAVARALGVLPAGLPAHLRAVRADARSVEPRGGRDRVPDAKRRGGGGADRDAAVSEARGGARGGGGVSRDDAAEGRGDAVQGEAHAGAGRRVRGELLRVEPEVRRREGRDERREGCYERREGCDETGGVHEGSRFQ